MARADSDVGPGSLSAVTTFSFLVLVGCLVFLLTDYKHRADGYQAVMNGRGVPGTVEVAVCETGFLFGHCTGTFTSDDGGTVKTEIRINGADTPGVVRAAVLSEGGSVWTATGRPWMRPSPFLLAALAPFAVFWMAVSGSLRRRSAPVKS